MTVNRLCDSIAQLIFTLADFVDLRDRRPGGHNLGNLGDEGPILLGVEEFLALANLEFSLLLNESKDVDSVGTERDTVNRGARARCLRPGCASPPEET